MGKTAPKTFTGTSNKGKQVSVTAKSASTVLDYDGIESACEEALQTANDEMKAVSKQLHEVQMGKEALCVEDKDMQPVIDEIGDYVMSIPEQGIAPTLEEIKSTALEKYNKKQDEFNQEAEADFNRQIND